VVVYQTHNDEGLVLAITFPNGTTQTFNILDGQIYENGSSNPVPITPQLKDFLRDVFKSLGTTFYQLVSYDYDRTQTRESTDFGF
jgi:hypothetical protein